MYCGARPKLILRGYDRDTSRASGPSYMCSKTWEGAHDVDCTITYENVDALVATRLKVFRKVSRSLRRESEQIFYQCNLIVIQPMVFLPNEPPPRLNRVSQWDPKLPKFIGSNGQLPAQG